MMMALMAFLMLFSTMRHLGWCMGQWVTKRQHSYLTWEQVRVSYTVRDRTLIMYPEDIHISYMELSLIFVAVYGCGL